MAATTGSGAKPSPAVTWLFSSQVTRAALFVLAVTTSYVFSNCLITAVLSKSLLEGESGILSNVVVELAFNGRLAYPLHAQDLYYLGLELFIIHPPLHYLYVAQVVEHFGMGVLQLVAPSAALTIVGVLAATGIAWRVFGAGVGVLVPALAAAHANLYDPSLSLRADVMFGFTFSLFSLALGFFLLRRFSIWRTRLLLFLIGFLSIVVLASHWFGFFVCLLYPIVAAVQIRRSRTWFFDGMFAVLGIVVAFVPWYGLYGNHLFTVLVLMPLQGGQFLDVLNMGYRGLTRPFLLDPGGPLLLAGLGLALLLQAARLVWAVHGASGLRAGVRRLTPADKAGIFLLAICLLYAIFLFTAVGNRQSRYWINLYFLLMPLAAWGYVLACRLVVVLAERLLERPFGDLPYMMAGALAVVVLLTSSTVAAYFEPVPLSLKSPNVVYREIDRRLDQLVPKSYKTLMGGASYIYVYDRPMVSPFRIVVSFFFKLIEGESFLESLRAHFKQRGTLKPWTIERRQLRGPTVAVAEVIIASEDCHSHQCRFFDPVVWREDYIKIGTIVAVEPWINGRRPPMVKPVPRLLTVYIRNDVATRALAELDLPEGEVAYAEGVALVLPVRAGNIGADVSPDQWRSLDADGRIRALGDFLDRQEWFGRRPAGTERDNVLKELADQVNAAFNQREIHTLDQAMDAAFLSPATWELLDLKPRPERTNRTMP